MSLLGDRWRVAPHMNPSTAHKLSCPSSALLSPAQGQGGQEALLLQVLGPVGMTRVFGVCLFFFFLLEYNCFTMLCWFLLYNSVSQLCVYNSPSLLSLPPHPHPTP